MTEPGTSDLAIEPTIEGHLPPGERSLPGDVLAGLTARQMAIPPKHFYDPVGSELFERITRLPEYYPTRAEREILESQGDRIAELCDSRELVELGSGAAEKALLLIEPMVATGVLESYMAVEVSESALRGSLAQLASAHPDLRLTGHVADMTSQLDLLPPAPGRRTVALLGGTIGNFRPEPRRSLLAGMARLAGPEGRLLIGCDLVKDTETLIAAYDDSAGVTASFNLNLLSVINRELGANFDPTAFTHRAVWNEQEEWIEMRLRATRAMDVRVEALDLDVHLDSGEEILTETCAKFTAERIGLDLASAGLAPISTLTDEERRFALVVAGADRASG
ncbi:MAG: L-histidine N(alpha)-methyltransferase [Actinomycetes bacterium]